MNKILVIAAHPDDEALGCGGSMARHARRGDAVHVLILAQGITSRGAAARTAAAKEIVKLRAAARKANKLLGASSLSFGEFPDNSMDTVPQLQVVRAIEKVVARLRPAIVYTHHAGDVNVDHRVIHAAAITACRPQPGHSVRSLRFFEVPSSTEWQPPGSAPGFAPNWYNDISDTLAAKLNALAAYTAEMRDWPHPRSPDAVRALAQWRGACVGTAAAEAFVCGRHIDD